MRILLFFLFFIAFSVQGQFYNGSEQSFGKNRVQYFEFDWRSQNFERFKIYFYRGEENLVEFTAKSVQKELYAMEEKLNYSVSEHLEILVFKSLSEMRQSNVGLVNENEDEYGGKSQIVGNKLFLYHEGSQLKFQQQIRKVLAEAVIRNILFGEQWSDVLIANDPGRHPQWFITGMINFLSEPWNAELEAIVKDGFLTGKYDDFSRLNERESKYAGHAFWYYIEETYGRSQLMNILYITKISGHIDRSLQYVVGSGLDYLMPGFSNFYKKRFLADLNYQDDPPKEKIEVKLKKNEVLTFLSASQDGKNYLYVKNREGRYSLFVNNKETGKRKKLGTFENRLPRIQDESFPVACFHPNGDLLVYFNEYKGKMLFNLYDMTDGELITKEMPKLEKVLSAEYGQDGQTIVLSGVSNGQTDIYLYKISGNSLDALTEDAWDDINPSWSLDGKKIFFSSNRTNDTLPKGNALEVSKNQLDLFALTLKDKNKNKVVLERITDTPNVNEKEVREITPNRFVYLADQNGLWNIWNTQKDSVVAFIDTAVHYRYTFETKPLSNYNTSIQQLVISDNNTMVWGRIRQNNKSKIITSPLTKNEMSVAETYFKRKKEQKQGPQYDDDSMVKSAKIDSVIPKNIYISPDSTFEKEILVLYQNKEEYLNQNNLINQRYRYERPRMDKYKVNFAKDFISAKIENSFLSQSYQTYTGPGSVYQNPSVSGLLRISFSDVMEDYVFSGAIRIPTSRNNSEFFVSTDFLRKRVDKQISYYRRSYEAPNGKGADKLITHEIHTMLKYPFSEVFSFRTSFFSRTDIRHPLAMDKESLTRPVTFNYQGGVKWALVFDNAREYSENTWSGTRAKVFLECLQNVNSKEIGMINLGFDVRHSIYLFKDMVWVNRLASATSVGNSRLIYFMGGVDNWMLRPEDNFNKNIPVDPEGRFAYQTLATPMRGFMQNQRNGNSFFVYNSELRIPIFKLLSKKPVRNEPLRSFQFIGFFDLGSAWTGPHPFSEKNYFNIETIVNKPAVIKIVNGREPIIAASGIGARSKIFGYFVRADLGWGIENGVILKKPRLFLSLTHDI